MTLRENNYKNTLLQEEKASSILSLADHLHFDLNFIKILAYIPLLHLYILPTIMREKSDCEIVSLMLKIKICQMVFILPTM